MQSLKLFCTQEDYGTHNAYIPNQNFITYVAEMEDIIAQNIARLLDYKPNFYRASASIACRARYCLSYCVRLSVRPSVRPSVTQWYLYRSRTVVTKLQLTQQGPLNTRQVGKFAIFDPNPLLSLKRYEIGPWLLWVTQRKSQVADRSVSVSMTLNDLERPDVRVEIFSGRSPQFFSYRLTQNDHIWQGSMWERCVSRGQPRPASLKFVTQILTRDLFAAAKLLV